MHFIINLNGNTYESMAITARRLHAALDALEGALGAVNADILHGRNYQLNKEPEHDRGLDLQAHDTAVACFVSVRNYYEALVERISEQTPL